MKTVRYLTDDELIEKGVEALVKALGPVETARFLNLRRAGRIESVKRHRRWQTKLNQKEFLDEVFGHETQN